jgi:16S rRNA (uracil1498-N3)-methyltransferase
VKHTFRCIVHDLAPGATVDLSPSDTHHLIRVARRSIGDDIEVIDAEGQLWGATIIAPGPPARVLVAGTPTAAPLTLPVRLWVGLADFGRLDTLVEKATELGVQSIAVISSARVRRVPEGEAFISRRARMIRVAQAAAKQSGRAAIPSIEGVVPFTAMLATPPVGTRVLVDPRGTVAIGQVLRQTAGPLEIIIGPDAGFESGELDTAAAARVEIARMGDAVLRTETAAIAAVVIAAESAGLLGT